MPISSSIESASLLSKATARTISPRMAVVATVACSALVGLGVVRAITSSSVAPINQVAATTDLAATISTKQVVQPPKKIHLSDPETSTPAFSFLAIGDWGGTLGKDKGDAGSCCKLYNGGIDVAHDRYKVDFYSQAYVAELMAQSATQLQPVLRILNHGDNFYWNGVGTSDAKYRFEQTFEKVYNQTSLRAIPWLSVLGNHDIGGATFICGDEDGKYRECDSKAELLEYMDKRFDAQASYKSPHHNRWVLRDHYFVERVHKHGVSVDVFNIDTNDAENHGGKDVCCQCYGYMAKLGIPNYVCNDPQPGDIGCAGGDVELWQACYDKLESWANESYTRMKADLATSTATFKIVNTHFSPHYHMTSEKMNRWYDLCRDGGVTAWFNGHTHSFNHDVSKWGTHFFQNGGGGGYFSQDSPSVHNDVVKTQWLVSGNPYGYMELRFSHDWLKVQFATFDDQWQFNGMLRNESVVGGVARGHCWYIPRDHMASKGIECDSSVNGAIGAPLGDTIHA
ncbi:Aste57867_3269 [Aphanomyces stellatus]|uniref:Aste57867_3269 protein n=1 Tax=Aphanomyces stellatus TaxID=120398 RepID=A0A485KD63_9STRA|nr:hypothetical protein As57867_003259 [Aphanomyces stellatus]VFT80441.1 Aste57867_3269 [Aphanomyces stellatus]